MTAVEEVAPGLGMALACRALDLPRASLYRMRRPLDPDTSRPKRLAPPRALSAGERQAVLDTLHSERFMDQPPAQVHAALLDEGTYLCSPRTMYRVLDSAQEVKERRNQVRRPHYVKPELLATEPNQVWSWDITKLMGPAKWTYFYLYVILDIFSRYVVGRPRTVPRSGATRVLLRSEHVHGVAGSASSTNLVRASAGLMSCAPQWRRGSLENFRHQA